VRVLAATNRSLESMIKEKQFREDLFFRLSVMPLVIPPLRQRRGDIPQLVEHFVRTSSVIPKRNARLSPEAMETLQRYAWPGNVRAAEVIDAPDLPAAPRESSGPRESEAGAAGAYESMPLRDALAALEKHLITRALEKAGGNRAEAARILGIARPQLYVKLEEHGLRGRE